jgi:hypothetical protein
MDIRAYQIERFDAEVLDRQIGDIPNAPPVAYERHKSAHIDRPDSDLAVSFRGD